MYAHGGVMGKFYPFHLGHEEVIQTAKRLCERVTIFVIWTEGEDPPGSVRTQWLRQAHPDCNVIDAVGLATDDTDPASSTLWAEYTNDILDGDKLNVVFTSEHYGEWWARELGVDHHIVDPFRTLVPISGTSIRSDPMLHFHYLHPQARPHYLRRVLVVGAESTGKSTLCRNLASLYGTHYVGEYGRAYVERKGGLEQTDHRVIFGEILNRQTRLEDEMALKANRLLFLDTDLYTTALWYELWQPDNKGDALHQSLLGEARRRVAKYDLVLIQSHEGAAWVNDGMRDQENTRAWFTDRFDRYYGLANSQYSTLTGSWDERLREAMTEINQFFTRSGYVPPDPDKAVSKGLML